jgi:splicing factor 3B subunit 2
LKEALGMVDGSPTPWLHNMQRIGPPPSYPGLRIPGLNAPLPPGAAYGFHPGGWGKPPMDHHGRPLYAEALINLTEEQAKYYEYQHWGQLPPEVHVEESVEEQPEESSASENEENAGEPQGDDAYDPLAADGLETPLSGMDTPANIEGQLRKRKKDLYEVLEETEAHISSKDIYGSTHKYLIDKKQLKEVPGEQVELSIDPSEITTLTEDTLKKRAADKFTALENKHRLDLPTDAEGEQKKRKRTNTNEKSKKKKKTNDFKF